MTDEEQVREILNTYNRKRSEALAAKDTLATRKAHIEATAAITELLRKAREDECDRLSKASGGGDWRRKLILRKAELQKESTDGQ